MIRVTSVALPKSPTSLACDDEVPQIFTRKPRLRPLEFLTPSAKRLLQHYRAISGLHAGTPARSRSVARVIRRPAIFRNATVLPKFSDMSDDLSAL
jgi:hypothetical protein